jgi:hypothetical protein
LKRVVSSDASIIGCNCCAHPLERSVVLGSDSGPGDRIASTGRRPGQAERPDHRAVQPLAVACPRANSAFLSGAARVSASKPARAQRAQEQQEGPRLGFSVRDPASPGVACFASVPLCALLARHWRSKSRHPSQDPRAHGQSAASRAHTTSESVPLDFNSARRRVRLAPSVSVPQGSQAVSTPRAVIGQHNVRPTRRASRAERPAPQPTGPGTPAERITARPGPPPICPAARAGLLPAFGRATSTAAQGPPGYRSRPRPAPPPLGLRHRPTKRIEHQVVTTRLLQSWPIQRALTVALMVVKHHCEIVYYD